MTFEFLKTILQNIAMVGFIMGIPVFFGLLFVYAVIEHVYIYMKTGGTMIVTHKPSQYIPR